MLHKNRILFGKENWGRAKRITYILSLHALEGRRIVRVQNREERMKKEGRIGDDALK